MTIYNQTYPRFFKSNGTFTCVINESEFMQVQLLKFVSRVTYGKNKLMIEDVINNDLEIKASDFGAAITMVVSGVQEVSDKILDNLKH